jgi:methionine synthase II (cobalamin-independent)
MSQNKILTTHTGSLPRPHDLIQMMWAKGDGIPIDETVLDERIASAVENNLMQALMLLTMERCPSQVMQLTLKIG